MLPYYNAIRQLALNRGTFWVYVLQRYPWDGCCFVVSSLLEIKISYEPRELGEGCLDSPSLGSNGLWLV